MDPVACILNCLSMFDAYREYNYRDDKITLLENLLEYSKWINRGGFDPPSVTYKNETHSGRYWFDWIMDRM